MANIIFRTSRPYFNGLRLPVELVVSSSGTDETLLYLPVELRVGPSDCAKAYIVDPSSEGVTLKKLSKFVLFKIGWKN